MTGKLAFSALAVLLLSACSSTQQETKDIGNRRLFSSIRYPSVVRMQYALNHGADPNARDPYQVPVLTRAVAAGKTEHVKLLLDRGAKADGTDSDGETAIFAAVALDNTEILEILLKNGTKIDSSGKSGKTPLMEAARLGNLKALAFLIRNGADINAVDKNKACAAAYAAEADKNGVEVLKYLMKNGLKPDTESIDPQVSPFLRAAALDKTETALFLLDQMPDFNTNEDLAVIGKLASYQAVFHNDMKLLRKMVEKKLPLNYSEPLPYRAAKLFKVDGLYKLSARNELVERNYTPLIYACIYGRPQMVEFLIDSGANPFLESTEGQIAESYARDLATVQTVRRKAKEWRQKYLDGKINPPTVIIRKNESVRRSTIL